MFHKRKERKGWEKGGDKSVNSSKLHKFPPKSILHFLFAPKCVKYEKYK